MARFVCATEAMKNTAGLLFLGRYTKDRMCIHYRQYTVRKALP